MSWSFSKKARSGGALQGFTFGGQGALLEGALLGGFLAPAVITTMLRLVAGALLAGRRVVWNLVPDSRGWFLLAALPLGVCFQGECVVVWLARLDPWLRSRIIFRIINGGDLGLLLLS